MKMFRKGPARRPLSERFWEKVDKRGPDDCWRWLAACDLNGYGVFSESGHQAPKLKAHRVAWEQKHGPVPEGLELDHLCENKACCNPAHLEAVAHVVNVERTARVRTTTCPHGHPLDGIRRDRTRKGDVRTRRYCKACHRAREALRVR